MPLNDFRVITNVDVSANSNYFGSYRKLLEDVMVPHNEFRTF